MRLTMQNVPAVFSGNVLPQVGKADLGGPLKWLEEYFGAAASPQPSCADTGRRRSPNATDPI